MWEQSKAFLTTSETIGGVFVAKKVLKKIKLEIPAGKATPAPPVGTILGPAGVNLNEFCTRYNEMTKEKIGDVIPVEISIYEDKSFDLVLKTPPTSSLIKKYAKIEKGSAKGANELVATITEKDLREIAEIKMPDLNAYDVEAAMHTVTGTARNMGVAIKGVTDVEMAEQAEHAKQEELEMAKREAQLEKMEMEMQEEREPEVLTEKAKEDGEETTEN